MARPESAISRLRSRSSRALGLEIFADGARLTRALEKTGLAMSLPVDIVALGRAYVPERDTLVDAVFERYLNLIDSGTFSRVHFGLPRSSWSQLQRTSGSTRTVAMPQGSEEKPSEVKGDLLAARPPFGRQACRARGSFHDRKL